MNYGIRGWPPERLERSFDRHWPHFESILTDAIMSAGGKVELAAPSRDTRDMVSELLELVREMKRELNNREQMGQFPAAHSELSAGGQLEEYIKQQVRSQQAPRTRGVVRMMGFGELSRTKRTKRTKTAAPQPQD